MEIEYIDIDYIIPNENQPRKVFREEAMEDLTESVRRNGIIQPVILKKTENGFRIIAGERRWRAAMSLNMSEVPAIVMDDVDEEREKEISIIENLQRENLSPIEEAAAFKEFLDSTDNKQEDLAGILGKSRSYISNTMRLLTLPEEVIEDLKNFRLSAGHARAVLSLKDRSLQTEFSKRIQRENLTVRDSEMLARKLNESPEYRDKDKKINRPSREERLDRLIEEDIEKRLTESLGAKVNLKRRKNRRIIEIECSDENQLEILVDLLENHSDNKQSKEQ